MLTVIRRRLNKKSFRKKILSVIKFQAGNNSILNLRLFYLSIIFDFDHNSPPRIFYWIPFFKIVVRGHQARKDWPRKLAQFRENAARRQNEQGEQAKQEEREKLDKARKLLRTEVELLEKRRTSTIDTAMIPLQKKNPSSSKGSARNSEENLSNARNKNNSSKNENNLPPPPC